jgi:hypothetical protein
MFNNYKPTMFSSCSSQFGVADDSGPEIGQIWNAIQNAAGATKGEITVIYEENDSNEQKVDHRFILAVIMQESSGCVRVV